MTAANALCTKCAVQVAILDASVLGSLNIRIGFSIISKYVILYVVMMSFRQLNTVKGLFERIAESW